jgi:hypothetical protein
MKTGRAGQGAAAATRPAKVRPEGESAASDLVQKTAAALLSKVRPLIEERLTRLTASGQDVGQLEGQAGQIAAAMVKALPAVSSPADVMGPVWTTQQVRTALGPSGRAISRQAVDDRVSRGTLLALPVEEAGERAYPLWQFEQRDGRWRVLDGLAGVLQAVPEDVANRWTLASWLQRAHPALAGRSPLEALRAGDKAAVLEVARATAERWSR